MTRNSNSRGFTLIELIVIFAVLAFVLTYMLGSSFIGARNRARDSQRKTELTNLGKVMEEYFNDNGRYPPAAADGSGRIESCVAPNYNQPCDWGDEFRNSAGTIYLGRLPIDIREPDRTYMYRTGPNGLAWQLYAKLEAEDDPILDRNGDDQYVPADDDYLFTDCGPAGNCNFGISSGNISPSLQDLSAF
jgi:type II secretory pathway pseudopilin PulG